MILEAAMASTGSDGDSTCMTPSLVTCVTMRMWRSTVLSTNCFCLAKSSEFGDSVGERLSARRDAKMLKQWAVLRMAKSSPPINLWLAITQRLPELNVFHSGRP